VNKDEQIYSITTNIQYDSHFQYDNYPYHYTLKTLLEEGATKTTDTDLRKSADELDIRNTILYYLFEEIGFYGRLDFNTHLINDYVYLGKGVDYVKFSSDEELEEFHAAEENESLEMKKNSSFFPLEMKQGFGINLQLLNGSNTNLSLRGGLGFRQDLNKDVYSTLAEDSNLAQQDTIAGYDLTNANKYIALENNFTEGTEISAVANFKLPVDLSYSTYAEILIPFDKEESVSTEWENSFDLRLFKYVSLNYKLKLSNKPSELGDDYWLTEHSLFLRISYFIR
jgi:hypothetical protein